MCFGGRKTLEEWKICLKTRFFGFPQRFEMGSATTVAPKVVSSWTLIGPFKIWARAQIQWPLSFALKFKWANQSWGWKHLANGRCRGPLHKHLRKAEEPNFKANFSFFSILSTAEAQGIWSEIYWASWNCWFYCDSGLFPLRRKQFVELLLTSDGWSGLPFHSFRRRSNSFK